MAVSRQIVLPVEPEELWSALTDPGRLRAWFGSAVDWELAPGGQAHFVDDDGTERFGVVSDVQPGHRLCWRWWPARYAGGPEGSETSEVTWLLKEVPDGTQLTVTEQRTVEPAPAGPVACASAGLPSPVGVTWDIRLVGLWLGSTCRHAACSV